MYLLKTLANTFYHHYDRYKENSLRHKRIKPSDILPLLQNLSLNDWFAVKPVGRSFLGKEIFLITVGQGKNKVFMWSQMHGDESTATMAIFDLIKFLSAQDEFDPFRKRILQENTIYILPMLNPDGAELFQRRNALEIDLNRDALSIQSPEALILKNVFELIKPEYGFNLHDQSERYSVGNSYRQAAISFLAPPSDAEKAITPNRKRAMQIISELKSAISDIIPGHIAKYPDEYEPRAFGDNFQKWGMSTVLIESGGWKDDSQKQFVRMVNFVLFISALECITAQSFRNIELQDYELIPENNKYIMDLILRNLTYAFNDKKVLIDIGINREELSDNTSAVYFKSLIEDVGDLSTYFGIEDYDLRGFEISSGKITNRTYSTPEELQQIEYENFYNEGITTVRISAMPDLRNFTQLPFNLIRADANRDSLTRKIRPGESADLILARDGKIEYVIVNGFLYNTVTRSGKIINGIIE